jgi:sugar phosphate isomerase/epimerase
MSSCHLSRRELLAAAAPALAAAQGAPGPLKLCIFSKHFHWTNWQETAAMSAEIGFDGVDLTVRPGGHVLPESVERDLPKAVETIRKVGLEVAMITAGIVDAQSPHAEAILRSAAGLGIRCYRWGGFPYSYDRPIAAQLEELKPRVRALADLNARYNICAMYHTHSGLRQVGASIWDIWLLVKDHDPRHVSINYDVGHATVEGGFGGWINSAHLCGPHLRGVALKDFLWGKNAKGQWQPQWCAAGAGMVNYAGFFEILKTARFQGPVQMHYEYPGLGGADNGSNKLGIDKARFVAILKRDLTYVKGLMRQAQLV